MLGFIKVYDLSLYLSSGHVFTFEDVKNYEVEYGIKYSITFIKPRRDPCGVDSKAIVATKHRIRWTHKLVLWFKY